MSDERKLEPYKTMWSNHISVVDLQILHALREGRGSTNLDEYFSDIGFKFSRPYLKNKVEEMKKREIILEEKTVIVNPRKIFDYMFLTFVKIHLPAVRGVIDWRGAHNEIVELNRRYNILSMTFTVEGTGEYDLVLFVFVNDVDVYYEFIAELTRLGWVEKVDGKKVHAAEKAGFLFTPSLLPDVAEYRKAVRKYHKELGSMIQEEETHKKPE